jgi:hypothetical protein
MSMRLRLAVLALCLAVAPVAAAALPFKAKLTAATHSPKINTKWPYSVRVTTLSGKPMRATITVQIVDPLGGVHAVQLGNTTKDVTNRPFTGTFRDYVIWPPSSATTIGGVSVTLVFRTIVKTAKGKVRLKYDVTPHT